MRRRLAITLIATGTALALGVFFYREQGMWMRFVRMVWLAALAMFAVGLALLYRRKEANRGFEVMRIKSPREPQNTGEAPLPRTRE